MEAHVNLPALSTGDRGSSCLGGLRTHDVKALINQSYTTGVSGTSYVQYHTFSHFRSACEAQIQ